VCAFLIYRDIYNQIFYDYQNYILNFKTRMNSIIYPVILSGGSGKRLWPLSTKDMPKQFHALYSDKPMIVETAHRFQGVERVASPTIICANAHRFHVAAACDDYELNVSDIIIEPEAKNTAAATYIAAKSVFEKDEDGLVLILPADHYIHDQKLLQNLVIEAADFCEKDTLMTFGVKPTAPETGYGYIQQGDSLGDGFYQVKDFTEKPDQQTAQAYLDNGAHLWNSGIFLGYAETLLKAFEKHAATIALYGAKSYENAQKDLDFVRLEELSFAKIPSISVDYAIMEVYANSIVKKLDIEWNDLGSWHALYDIAEKDLQGNHIHGQAFVEDAKNCYIRSSNDRSVAVLGAEDLIVIAAQNAVMVAHKDNAQDINKVYAMFDEQNCPSLKNAIKRQPWGYAKTLIEKQNFAAKEINLQPFQKTATQIHKLRHEHWVVLEGVAKITLNGKVHILNAGESLTAAEGVSHTIENNTDRALKLFEVQSGQVEQDDILRIIDNNEKIKAV
jgi:mannose-1-phosphate guanylyltransferase/mannose-6-phosphate isomerase